MSKLAKKTTCNKDNLRVAGVTVLSVLVEATLSVNIFYIQLASTLGWHNFRDPSERCWNAAVIGRTKYSEDKNVYICAMKETYPKFCCCCCREGFRAPWVTCLLQLKPFSKHNTYMVGPFSLRGSGLSQSIIFKRRYSVSDIALGQHNTVNSESN